MATDDVHPAVARLLDEAGVADAFAVLSDRVGGADLTSLLMDLARRRADRVGPHDVRRQYERDRFVRPGSIDALRLNALERLVFESTADLFEPVVLAPLVPFGTHAALGAVHQDRVVSTTRGTEVAADPTTALALEVAARRQRLLDAEPRSAALVRLVAVTRVVRAQRFTGPRSFAHFALAGLVTAGRDTGDRSFESAAVAEHVCTLAAILRRAGAERVVLRLTDFGGRHGAVVDAALAAVAAADVVAERWPERTAARGYYPDVCFKVGAIVDGQEIEIGDGGTVGWTQALLGNGKERLMTSGVSLERLAMLDADQPGVAP